MKIALFSVLALSVLILLGCSLSNLGQPTAQPDTSSCTEPRRCDATIDYSNDGSGLGGPGCDTHDIIRAMNIFEDACNTDEFTCAAGCDKVEGADLQRREVRNSEGEPIRCEITGAAFIACV